MRRLPVIVLLTVVFGVTPVAAAKKIALVIGNDNYQYIAVLQKARADAQSYAKLLKSKGFEVSLKTDVTRGEMDAAVAEFTDKVDPGDTAVFAYSGHGWSDGQQNFLVGTDVPAEGGKELLARLSMPLKNGSNGIIDAVDQKGAALKVAIIDACRNNPFRSADGSRGIGMARGLAPIKAPRETFIVFSAGEGETALDRLSDSDTNPNSVFTRVFVPLLSANDSLQVAIKRAQARVATLARGVDHDQRPAYYDEVIGPACLVDNCESTPVSIHGPSVEGEEPAAADNDPVETVRAFYTALGRADGDAAAALIAPAKRHLDAFQPDKIRGFWGSLPGPLRLVSVTGAADGSVVAKYRYRRANGSTCSTRATVTTVDVDGKAMIDHIDAPC